MPDVRRIAALLGLGALAAAIPFLGGCGGADSGWPDRPGPKAVVSFAPIYCFVANVAGDDASVQNLMTTTGPHHFHPTDKEARLLRKADLLFINGLQLDNKAAKDAKDGAANEKLTVVDLGGRFDEAALLEGACHHEHGDGAHEHGDDPHVWLGPDRAAKMVEGVRDALKLADPAHADGYDRRAYEYAATLSKLKADGLEMLKDKKDKRLVTFHDSMAYFAKEFGLKVIGVVRKNPESEPSPDDLRKLVQTCAAKGVGTIAVEPQYGRNDSAKTVLEELKHKGVAAAAFVEFDPLETVPPAELTPDWYERKMRENLKNLADALK